MRLLVELSCLSRGAVLFSSSGMMRCASALPSSTPHWSKEFTFQIVPCVKTMCSYKRDEFAEHCRRELVGENDIGRTVALEHAMRHQRALRAFGPDFIGGFAKRQRLGLGKNIRHQNVVMPAQLRQRVAEGDEVARNQPRALMDELIE